MDDAGPPPHHREFQAVLTALGVGTVELAPDGFVGLIGGTGLLMRAGGPTHLGTVQVRASLVIPRELPGRNEPAALAHAILPFELEVNAAALAIARAFA